MIAKILVDVPVKALDRLFDYLVPPALEDVIEIGMRVVVPFGTREMMGYCLEIDTTSSIIETLKPIYRLLDLEPYLTAELILLAKDIAKESTTVLLKVLETILPSAMRAVYQTKLRVLNELALPKELQDRFLDKTEIILTSSEPHLRLIKQALKDNLITQVYDVSSKAKPKYTKMIQLIKTDPLPTSEKQKIVIRALLKEPLHQKTQSDLLMDSSASISILRTLYKHGYITFIDKEAYREVKQIQPSKDKTVALNNEQELAFQTIQQSSNESCVFLLHGVTGSGKTEIYLKSIEQVLSKHQEAIFLVPEIALTPLMVSRIKGRFGNNVAILHSGLSVGEKYDEWRRIIRKEVQIAIGARSAIFAPFERLGLICVDECHEQSYDQEDVPRYHALDVAIRRSKYHQIPVIFGSATPNIETFARAKRGYFTLLELRSRYLNQAFPKPVVVDMKQEFMSGNHYLLSNQLDTLLKDRLEKKEQTILLINRRGYSTFILCRSCGHVIMCPSCDISLTYHETEHALKCHYCGHKEGIPKVCPKCQSEHLRFMGTGSQKIEQELKERYPLASIVRMDNDTTRTKNAHELLLHEFETSGDILLGTQMIAKGLDYPKVTLVGIINADSNLYNADFRAPERTFQLITQVSGRAGRNQLQSDVVIQVHNPNHYAITFAVNNDYEGFYQHEMHLRRLAKYIPFYYMAEITLSGLNMRDLLLKGKDIVKTLKSNLSVETIVLGPLIPQVARIKNRYQAILTIKYKSEPGLEPLLFQIKELYETEDVYVSIHRSSTLV
ncbi:MAG: primosomal protein N' [Candidatus Izemoplasmatales bacterium]|nr:primosomal protein N' [Candidatus Izemoplasmatales bacterium]